MSKGWQIFLTITDTLALATVFSLILVFQAQDQILMMLTALAVLLVFALVVIMEEAC